MSRPETFTLRCDRCGKALTDVENKIVSAVTDSPRAYHFTSHRQATLGGNEAGWRLTSLEEVCAECVAKERAPLSACDPDDFDGAAVRAALKSQKEREDEEAREIHDMAEAEQRELDEALTNGPGGTSDD